MAKQRSSDQDGTRFAENAERLKDLRKREESRLERIRREMNELRGIEAIPQLSEPVPAAQEAPTETAPSSATSAQEVPTGEEVAVQGPSLTEIVVETDAVYIEENLPIAEVGQEETLAETAIEEAQAAEEEEMVAEEAEAEAAHAEEAAEEAEAEAAHAEVEAAIAEESAEEARATAIIA